MNILYSGSKVSFETVLEELNKQSEGGSGKPLGNKSGNNLTGLLKVKLKKEGLRIVYKLIRTENIMYVLVVGVRSDNEVYDIAAE